MNEENVPDINTVSGLQFSIASPDNIRKNSVVSELVAESGEHNRTDKSAMKQL